MNRKEPRTPMNCEGCACNAVEITWDGSMSAYRVRNLSELPILVVLTHSLGTVSLRVSPGEAPFMFITEFDLPFEARYCE